MDSLFGVVLQEPTISEVSMLTYAISSLTFLRHHRKNLEASAEMKPKTS